MKQLLLFFFFSFWLSHSYSQVNFDSLNVGFEKRLGPKSFKNIAVKIFGKDKDHINLLYRKQKSVSVFYDAYGILSVDKNGNVISNIDPEYGEFRYCDSEYLDAVQTDDGSFYVASCYALFLQSHIQKYDSLGNLIWDSMNFPLSEIPNSTFKAIEKMPGNEVMAGGAFRGNTGEVCDYNGPLIFRMDTNGAILWQLNLTATYPLQGVNKIRRADDGYYDVWLTNAKIKVDSAGNILPSMLPTENYIEDGAQGFYAWSQNQIKHYDASLNVLHSDSFPATVVIKDVQRMNSSLFITGIDSANSSEEMWVAALDTTFAIYWQKYFGGDQEDAGASVFCNDSSVFAFGQGYTHTWSLREANTSCRMSGFINSDLILVSLPYLTSTSASVQISSSTKYLCENQSVTLTAPLSASYLWNNGDTNQVITTDTTGDWQVMITDGLGNKELLPAIALFEYPTIQYNATSTQQNICVGSNFCLYMPYVDTLYDRDYSWYKDGIYVGTYPNYYDYFFQPADSGTYYCVVSNACSMDTGDVYGIVPNYGSPVIPIVYDSLQALHLCPGDSLLLSLDTTLAYGAIWFKDGNFADAELFFNVTGSGIYTVNAFDVCFNNIYDTVQINFSPDLSLSLGNDTIICVNQTITFSPGAYSSYQWQDGSSLATYTILSTIPDTFSIYVMVTDSSGCIANDTTTLYFDPCLSATNYDEQFLISVFPMPLRDVLHVESEKTMTEWLLLDGTGHEVMSQTCHSKNMDADISTLGNGFYLLKVFSGKSYSVKYLLKQ